MIEAMTVKQKQLYEKVRQLDDSGCWIWQGQVSNSGYGRTKVVQAANLVITVSAQTASYQAFIADVPSGSLVKQQCGNRLCINPEHLELTKI